MQLDPVPFEADLFIVARAPGHHTLLLSYTPTLSPTPSAMDIPSYSFLFLMLLHSWLGSVAVWLVMTLDVTKRGALHVTRACLSIFADKLSACVHSGCPVLLSFHPGVLLLAAVVAAACFLSILSRDCWLHSWVKNVLTFASPTLSNRTPPQSRCTLYAVHQRRKDEAHF